ncbi:MAG: hypothetical protein ACT4OX_00090 [Actinomycetota bacterium]
MLWFERQVVATLMNPALDADTHARVQSYVDSTLRSMPEHLRAGVAVESIAFGAWSRLEDAFGRLDRHKLAARVDRFRASRVDVVRQYVRLLQSLVLFAEHEFAEQS